MDIISQDLNFEPPESREEFEKKFFNFKIDGFERVFCGIKNYLIFPVHKISNVGVEKSLVNKLEMEIDSATINLFVYRRLDTETRCYPL